jgi:hypothetical protein
MLCVNVESHECEVYNGLPLCVSGLMSRQCLVKTGRNVKCQKQETWWSLVRRQQHPFPTKSEFSHNKKIRGTAPSKGGASFTMGRGTVQQYWPLRLPDGLTV